MGGAWAKDHERKNTDGYFGGLMKDIINCGCGVRNAELEGNHGIFFQKTIQI